MSKINPGLSIMGLVTDDALTSADFDCEQLESQNLPRCMHSKEISEGIAAALTDPINFTENELNRLIQFVYFVKFYPFAIIPIFCFTFTITIRT